MGPVSSRGEEFLFCVLVCEWVGVDVVVLELLSDCSSTASRRGNGSGSELLNVSSWRLWLGGLLVSLFGGVVNIGGGEPELWIGSGNSELWAGRGAPWPSV